MILFVFFIIFFLFTKHTIKDPISKYLIWIFVIIWSYQIIFSLFGFYGLYIPREKTYCYVSIHLIFFYLGFLLFNSVGCSKVPWKAKHISINNELEKYCDVLMESKLLVVVLLVALAYVIFIFSQFYTQLMLMNSLGAARDEFFEEELFGFGYTMINGFILMPLNYLFLFLFGYMTFKKRNWLWGLIGVYLFVSFSLNGSRIDYPRFIITILCASFFFVNKKVLNKRERRKVFIYFTFFAAVMYLIIIAVTSLRSFSLDTVQDSQEEGREMANQQLFTYSVGPIVAFDNAINTDLPSRIGGYKYGLLTFSCIEDFAQKFINKGLGFYYKRPINAYAEQVQNRKIDISSEFDWNALYTWCNFFYCDLGLLGLIIFPFLFGVFYRSAVSFYYRKPSAYSAILLLYLSESLIFSIAKYMMFAKGTFVLLVICIYFGNKKKALTHPVNAGNY